MRGRKVFVALLWFVVWVGAPVWAQTVTGTILGTLADKTGAVLPGVTVSIRNMGTNQTRAAVTDAAGRYRETQLAIGSYEVKAELTGFVTQILQPIQLTIGSELVINLTLDVGAVQQSVVVTTEAPIVQTSSAEVAALVDQRMIQQLPLNARDLQQLATLQPGVQSQAAYNNLYGANITVRGSRPEQNRYLLNGVDASTSFGTAPVSAANIIMGVEGLQEFKVLSSDYGAAYGVKQGGVVNMVTKAGTNEFHGSAYEFQRSHIFDARNFFDRPTDRRLPPFNREQFGGALGGPIIHGKTFFFTNYEQFRQRLGLSNVGTVPNARTRAGFVPDGKGGETFVGVAQKMAPFLNLFPNPNGPDLGDGTAQFFSNPQQKIDEKYITARVDHRLGAKDSLWGVYTGDWSVSLTPDLIPSFGLNSTRNKSIWSVENVHTFSPSFIAGVRVGVNRGRYFDWNESFVPIDRSMFVAADPFVSPAPQGLFESISFSNLSGLAASGNAPVWFDHTGISVDTEFNYIRGKHAWKFGGSWSRLADDGSFTAVQARGEITFQTLTDFLKGVASRANVLVPGSSPEQGYRSQIASAYVEDSMRLSSRFTLTAGVRWEALLDLSEAHGRISNLRGGPMDRAPTTGNPVLIGQKDNFAPRVGFNWDVRGDGKTSIRGGAGIFYNLITPFTLREMTNNVPFVTQVSLNNVPFPNVFEGFVPSQAIPDFAAIQFRPDTPALYSYHMAVQRDVGGRTSVLLSYIGSLGRHLPSGNIVNSDYGNRLVPQVQGDGRYFWTTGLTRPNRNFGRIGYAQFAYNSSYNSLQAVAERRVGRGLAFTANYTYARCFDDVSGELNSALTNTGGPTAMQYSRDRRTGHGPCSFTSVHSANFTTAWELPGRALKGAPGAIFGRWRWSTISSIQGGYPFNVTAGFNRSRQNVGATGLGDRPNWAPGCDADNVILGVVNSYFNVNCFVLQDPGFLGNVPSRVLRGPGLFTSDWSLAKSFSFGGKQGEGKRIEVQAQSFNIFNRANFAVPSAALWSSATTRRAAGLITRTVTFSRQIQFGVKFVF